MEPCSFAKVPGGPPDLHSYCPLGHKKNGPRCTCLNEAKASHSQKMWAEVSSSAPHLRKGLLVIVSSTEASNKVTTLVCVLLKDISLVFWQLFTDILRQLTGLISKGKQFKKNAQNRWLHFYVGNRVDGDWLSGNIRETGCWSMKLPPAH